MQLNSWTGRWGDAIYAEDPRNDRFYMFINEV